jgi:hypothetical protein
LPFDSVIESRSMVPVETFCFIHNNIIHQKKTHRKRWVS